MKRVCCLSIAVAAAWCLAASADQPVIKLPDKADAKPGRICRISVQATSAVNVKWWVEGDADLFREYTTDGSISLCFSADPSAATTYNVRVIASGSKGELTDPATCVVTVGTPPPPPPPTPPDSLTAALQAAYSQDASDPLQTKNKDYLESLYNVAASTTTRDTTLTTVGALAGKVASARSGLIGAGLPQTCKAIDLYLVANTPTVVSQTLDDSTRAQFAKAYLAISTALANVQRRK